MLQKNPSIGSSSAYAFGIIQTPSGTAPTADQAHDTVTFTSTDGSVIITGNSATDSVNFSINDVYVNVAGDTMTGALLINRNGIDGTSTQALALQNTTAATGDVIQQLAPCLDFVGHGWATALGGSDFTARFRVETRPISGSSVTAQYVLQSSIDTGTASFTNHSVWLSSKPFIDQSVSGAAANNYTTFDTVDAVTSAGSGATAGFTWARFMSNGTLRLRLDWSAGSAIRWYAPGRMDFESAGQMFFTGTQFFMQAHVSINRTGDASSTATQKDSYANYFQNSLWTGSASTQRFSEIRSKASTTVNLDHRLAFFLNVTGGVGTDGTEGMALWWDNTLSQAKLGVGVTNPTATIQIKAGSTAANSAPLKFTSGSLNTTAEAGAVEFLTDNAHLVITTGAARKGFVLDDGTRLTSGKIPVATTNGRLIDLTASSAYTPTNVTTDRSYDANATSLDELADVVGTIISDLQAKGILG